MTAKLDLEQFGKYAPGPWHVVQVADDVFPAVVHDAYGRNILPLLTLNARLISAAPDLLAECKRQREQIAKLRAALTEYVERHEAACDPEGLPEYDKARAALAASSKPFNRLGG